MSRDIDHAIQRQRKKRKIELLEEALDDEEDYHDEDEVEEDA